MSREMAQHRYAWSDFIPFIPGCHMQKQSEGGDFIHLYFNDTYHEPVESLSIVCFMIVTMIMIYNGKK